MGGKVPCITAHSVMDKLEDPIKMTEQGIRDLKKDLQASMESLAILLTMGPSCPEKGGWHV